MSAKKTRPTKAEPKKGKGAKTARRTPAKAAPKGAAGASRTVPKRAPTKAPGTAPARPKPSGSALKRKVTLEWEGWFQIRTSTDPDPTDEPYGVSGFTFALPGEPLLDRVVRFASPAKDPGFNPLQPRSHSPPYGVTVRNVLVGKKPVKDHPLLGATIDLLPDEKWRPPTEEQRNNALLGDTGDDGYMFVDPFIFEIRKDDAVITCHDHLDPKRPEVTVLEATAEQLKRRGFYDMDLANVDAFMAAVNQAMAGEFTSYAGFRTKRRGLIERDVDLLRSIPQASRTPEQERGLRNLEFRLHQLMNTNTGDRPFIRLGATWSRRLTFNGKIDINKAARKNLGGHRFPFSDVTVEFWFGVFDCDTHSAYAKGTLTMYVAPI